MGSRVEAGNDDDLGNVSVLVVLWERRSLGRGLGAYLWSQDQDDLDIPDQPTSCPGPLGLFAWWCLPAHEP